jgi:hypothetical protein
VAHLYPGPEHQFLPSAGTPQPPGLLQALQTAELGTRAQPLWDAAALVDASPKKSATGTARMPIGTRSILLTRILQ